MDGRSKNGGHSTKGFAGRKSKAEELGLSNLLDAVIGSEKWQDLIRIVYKDAIAGSAPHQKLLFEYKFGKPKQQMDITSDGKTISLPSWIENNEGK